MQIIYKVQYSIIPGCPLLIWNEIPWLFTDFSLTKIHFPLTILPRVGPPYSSSPYSRLKHPRLITTDINQI